MSCCPLIAHFCGSTVSPGSIDISFSENLNGQLRLEGVGRGDTDDGVTWPSDIHKAFRNVFRQHLHKRGTIAFRNFDKEELRASSGDSNVELLFGSMIQPHWAGYFTHL